MKALLATGLLLGVAAFWFAGPGWRTRPEAAPIETAQAKQPSTERIERLIYSVRGPDLFRAHCAPCHGLDAKGDGPMAPSLKSKPADLTVLAKGNRGQFPSERVRKTILGDPVVSSHGSREMPIWGPIFHQIESDQDFGELRVQNLVKYLQSIQQK